MSFQNVRCGMAKHIMLYVKQLAGTATSQIERILCAPCSDNEYETEILCHFSMLELQCQCVGIVNNFPWQPYFLRSVTMKRMREREK